jgi:hypothetical protein
MKPIDFQFCYSVVEWSCTASRRCRGRRSRGRSSPASGTVRRGGAGSVGLTGVRVITRQLRQHQARWRRLGSGVRDGGIDRARWSRPAATAQGGVTSSFKCRGAGRWPRCWAMGADERGSGDSDGGAPVTATANFGSLVAYYAKSSTF